MRAKFKCESVNNFEHGQEVSLSAVQSSENQEDQDFNKYTPSGTHTMMIDNPDARDYFIPGKKYYLDFTEAE